MRFLSTNPLLTINKSLLLPPFNLPPQQQQQPNPRFKPQSPLSLKPTKPHPLKLSPISSSSSSFSIPITTIPQTPTTPLPPLSNWPEFAKRVSGEWDGFGAEFTPTGSPVELPETVVPEAFREWEVKLFDWQTQCPTLAKPESPSLSYKLIKLLPTVGCEADAATRYSVEERIAGGPESMVSGFGYGLDGSYVGVWAMGERGMELEHCLVGVEDRDVRVRVVMVVKWEEEGRMRLEGVRVFSEFWDGPWRNGEQMGGCAIKESGFALSERVEVGDVVGIWEGRSLGIARVGREGKVSSLNTLFCC